jgi:hypothetical protein
MAVLSNLNTTQTPLSVGLTGAQSVRWIDAPRVYIKTADSSSTPVTTKASGSTPSGWTDLGVVEGKVKISYEVERKEVRTGIDQVLRASYAGQKTASMEAVLGQFDDIVVKEVSGLTPSTITSGSIIQFAIGQGDVVQKALLLVSENKLDGKEWQFYHPNAFISFQIEDSGEATVVRLRGDLPAFTHGGSDTLIVSTIYK